MLSQPLAPVLLARRIGFAKRLMALPVMLGGDIATFASAVPVAPGVKNSWGLTSEYCGTGGLSVRADGLEGSAPLAGAAVVVVEHGVLSLASAPPP